RPRAQKRPLTPRGGPCGHLGPVTAHASSTGDRIVLGGDVGSTTVKAVVVDPGTRGILWSDYQRHETRQAEKVMDLLVAIGDAFPDVAPEGVSVFVTGSGAGPLRAPLGAK